MAQDDDDNDTEDNYRLIRPKHSYTIDIHLPTATSNQSLRGTTQGIIRLGASYNYSFKSGYGVGLGYHWNYLRIDKFKTPSFVTGGIGIQTVYGRINREIFFNERAGLEYACKVGYSFFQFSSDSLEVRTGNKISTAESIYVEPSIAFVLTVSGNSSCKWFLSYAFEGLAYDPTRIGLYNGMGFDPKKYERHMQYLSFGFSLTHYFSQHK